jgi:glutaredoxin 3
MSVIIYSKTICPYCDMAKNLLKMKGVTYDEIMIDKSDERLQEMLQRSDGRRTVPQIFINGKHVGGFDDLQQLENNGLLDGMLQ